MYGKVYKIEGDETSTEAATRLWVMLLSLNEALKPHQIYVDFNKLAK